MKKLKFTVEKGAEGYGAYRAEPNGIVATMGDTLTELKANMVEAYNLYIEDQKVKQITADDLLLEFDIPSFFEYYGIINAKALSGRIKMNYTLLSQYINGVKKPSAKQVEKILTGIKQVGKELSELDLV